MYGVSRIATVHSDFFFFFGGGGVMYFGGLQSTADFTKKRKGTHLQTLMYLCHYQGAWNCGEFLSLYLDRQKPHVWKILSYYPIVFPSRLLSGFARWANPTIVPSLSPSLSLSPLPFSSSSYSLSFSKQKKKKSNQ